MNRAHLSAAIAIPLVIGVPHPFERYDSEHWIVGIEGRGCLREATRFAVLTLGSHS